MSESASAADVRPSAGTIDSAEVCLPSSDLRADLAFYVDRLGFRLDTIFPADDPAVAVLSGFGVRLRIDRASRVAPGRIRLTCAGAALAEGVAREMVAPNGVVIELVAAGRAVHTPATQHAFVVRRLQDNTPWVIGRAGMQYRDLIPGRLGGSIIASHIRIPDAGPVPDMVHYHSIGFQLIFCYRGWVRLVYEDQGPPFVLRAGDCLIQPPEIRHRVLESSAQLEVIEVGVPAEHLTTIDHEMELPTATLAPNRDFGGQRFCRHERSSATWGPWRIAGFEAFDTGIGDATGGVASVQVARPRGSPAPVVTSHSSDILFTFVLSGSVTISGAHQGAHALSAGDAFVVPPHLQTSLLEPSPDLELLEVSLPARFDTVAHPAARLD
jgi:quercetin dioxygenase-like cupin family protein/catechol 2,3-dioxygenase-like lactoylglutathione lyase family enzyme